MAPSCQRVKLENPFSLHRERGYFEKGALLGGEDLGKGGGGEGRGLLTDSVQ